MRFYLFATKNTRGDASLPRCPVSLVKGLGSLGLALMASLFLVSCASRQAGGPEGLVSDSETEELEDFEDFEDVFGDASQNSVVGRYVGKKSNADTTIYFDYNSAYLALDGRTALDNTIEKIKEELSKRGNQNIVVRVEGHTDERGSDAYNLALGQRRAGAVSRYFSTKGIAGGNLQTVSYGETRPISSGTGEIRWAENRRVEIKYTNQ